MAKEFRNLGHITAFAVFAAVLCVYIPETMIARVNKKCDKKDGKYDCSESPMLKSLRKGIDAEQLLKCIDPSGRGSHDNAAGSEVSDLEKALSECSTDCVTGTCDEPECNAAINTVMAKNPLHAFNSEQLLDFNVLDQCSAPPYLGAKTDNSRTADGDDTCEFNGKAFMASGANCALLKRHHGLGLSALVLGGVWGVAVLVAHLSYLYKKDNVFSSVILGNADSGMLRIIFHVYSAITVCVMSYYVLSALNWGMRMNSCESPVALHANTAFAAQVSKDTFIGDSGSVVRNAIGSKGNTTDTMIQFHDVASEFIDKTENDTSFIKWTDLHFSHNPVHGLRNSTKANGVSGLCHGGIGNQLNAEPGSFYKNSIGISSVALDNYLRIATAFMLLPLALSLGLKTYANFNYEEKAPEDDKTSRYYWLARGFISAAVAVFFYWLAVNLIGDGWNDERCGKEFGFEVASLGSSKGSGEYHHKTWAQVSAFAMAVLATLVTIESVLHLLKQCFNLPNLGAMLSDKWFRRGSALFIFVTFIVFVIELGAIIGGNASDLCDPYLQDDEQIALTAGLFIIYGIICIFALLYGVAGAIPESVKDQLSGFKSMSYFQLNTMESFL